MVILRLVAHYCGIDVAAARGSHLCVLTPGEEGWTAEFYERGARPDVIRTVLSLDPAVVAIDAPQATRQNLLAEQTGSLLRDQLGIRPGSHARSRVCDALLIQRRLFLYQVPDDVGAAPDWMQEGFAFFDDLGRNGYRRLRPDVDARRVGGGPLPSSGPFLLETFPDAGFCALAGERPPKKATPAGAKARVDLLLAAGIRDRELALRSHDELDACVAALTAARAAHGEACWLGDPDEGVMVLPVAREAVEKSYAPAMAAGPARSALVSD